MSLEAPSSFCTVATKPCSHELYLFFHTMVKYHPTATVYVLADTITHDRLKNDLPKTLNIKWYIELDQYSDLDRGKMEAKGLFAEFLMSKPRIIEIALAETPDTMFLDCDIIILSPMTDVDKSKELGISPQLIQHEYRCRFGFFNAGTLWTKSKTLPDRWRFHTKTSRYYEQAAIEELAREYTHFMFNENYNFQTYRLIHPNAPVDDILKSFSVGNQVVIFKGLPIKFFHTHIGDSEGIMVGINELFLKLIKAAKMFDIYSLIIRSQRLKAEFAAS